MDIDRLDLSTETLRDLTDDELTHVAGGAESQIVCIRKPTQGDTFSPCQPLITTNCAR